MKLTVVVPCYNEELVIKETNIRLCTLCKRFSEKGLIDDYEIIYVDDGSRDDTLSLLKALAGKNKRVKIVCFSGNFGHQSALTAGLHHSTGDAAVSMDADLQDPPEVIEEMLYRFGKGYEIIYGVRKKRGKDTLFKRTTARFFYKSMSVMGVKLVYDHADFRLLSRAVLDEFKNYTEVNRFLRGIFPMMGFRQCTVEYERDRRFAGRSKYSISRMLSFAAEGVTSFTYFPLRMASFFGLVTSFAAVILTVWAIAMKIAGNALPGWASTVLPIYFFAGIQLVFLGIAGEYIGKVYMEVKRRPLFIIKEKFNMDD